MLIVSGANGIRKSISGVYGRETYLLQKKQGVCILNLNHSKSQNHSPGKRRKQEEIDA
jgi:hypothetical protein